MAVHLLKYTVLLHIIVLVLGEHHGDGDRIHRTRSKRASVEPVSCPNKAKQKEILKQATAAASPQSLRDHTLEFLKPNGEPRGRVQVSSDVHMFIGYDLANVIVIEAPDGLIVIDVLYSDTAIAPVLTKIRQEISATAPFKAIIYTHNHPDHIGGAKAVVDSQPEPIEVWAHKNLLDEFWNKWQFNKGLLNVRSFRQVGVDVPPGAFINGGLGPRIVLDGAAGLPRVPPTKVLDKDIMDVNIAGLDLQLVYMPGETRDQMGVYYQAKKMFMIGDNFYKTFPNLYAIRGTPPRPVEGWFQSIDRILQFDIEILVPSHTQAVVGKGEVVRRLVAYRDAMQYVHDQTVRLMNQGLHPDVIAQTVKLPPSLISDPDLLEHYGTVEWSSKTVFESRLGWFSGFPEDLFPLTPEDQSHRWLKLLPCRRLIRSAQSALSSGSLKDAKWAVQATAVLWNVRSTLSKNCRRKMAEVRKDAIIKLAEFQTSPNARNYLLRWVLEESCFFDNAGPVFTDTATILLLPVDRLIRKMSTLLKAELVDGITITAVLEFTDITTSFTLVVRNSVLETRPGDNDHVFDLKISLPLSEFRNILVRQMDLSMSSATVIPDVNTGEAFLKLFDDPTVSPF